MELSKPTTATKSIFENLMEPSLRVTLKSDVVFPACLPDPDPNPIEDSELSIFDAQKYFNDPVVIIQKPTRPMTVRGFDPPNSSPAKESNSKTLALNTQKKPTASSVASWNSQTGLLKNPPGSFSVSVRNPSPPKKPRERKGWMFGRNCPCYGGSSTLVDQSRPQTNANTVSVKIPPPWGEKPRVHAASHVESFRHASKKILVQKQNPKTKADDDNASDASSDLFEIESFSTQSNSFPMTPSTAAVEIYPPSEVSVDWSVATAEGFEKGSAVTNYSVNALSADYQAILRRREMNAKECDAWKRRISGESSMGPSRFRCAPKGGAPICKIKSAACFHQ